MNEIVEVNILKTTNELIDEHQHNFKREFAIAKVEEIFQTWAQKIKHHDVEFASDLKDVNSWNIDIIEKKSIDVDFSS